MASAARQMAEEFLRRRSQTIADRIFPGIPSAQTNNLTTFTITQMVNLSIQYFVVYFILTTRSTDQSHQTIDHRSSAREEADNNLLTTSHCRKLRYLFIASERRSRPVACSCLDRSSRDVTRKQSAPPVITIPLQLLSYIHNHLINGNQAHKNILSPVLLSSRKVIVIEDQFASPCPWT